MTKSNIIIAALLIAVSFVLAEGTVTQSDVLLGTPNKITLSWVSSTNGIASGDTTQQRGIVERVTFVPSATVPPTNLYDITLKDEHGIDLLAGQGANLASNANSTVAGAIDLVSTSFTNAVKFAVNGKLSLSVINAGSETQGQVVFYIR